MTSTPLESRTKRLSIDCDAIDRDIEHYRRLFEALSNPDRLRLVYKLYQGGEMNVLDISEYLGTTQANTSINLKILKDSGLVTYGKNHRDRRYHYYSLNRESLERAIEGLFKQSEEE